MDLTHNMIEYVNCCVGAFAKSFKFDIGTVVRLPA